MTVNDGLIFDEFSFPMLGRYLRVLLEKKNVIRSALRWVIVRKRSALRWVKVKVCQNFETRAHDLMWFVIMMNIILTNSLTLAMYSRV
jgi:hypothetical protein